MLTRRLFITGTSSAAALALLNTCTNSPSYISPHEPTDLEKLVKKSVELIAADKCKEAQDELAPEYENAKDDIGYCVLLSVAYAGSNNLSKSETLFRSAVNDFENSPETIITVRDRFRPLFGTESYNKTRERLRSLAPMTWPANLNDLWAVDGFLSLAEQKFDEAKQAFDRIIIKYAAKLPAYMTLMYKLAIDAKKRKDLIAEKGYKEMFDYFRNKLVSNNTPR